MITPLHNPAPPTREILKETAMHRAVILMKAQGNMSNKQIADAVGIAPLTVSNILRQPWAQERLLKLMHDKGEKLIEKRLAQYATEAMEVAYDLMQSAEKEETRARAAFKFLDLQIGQKIQVKDDQIYGDLQEEEKRLEEQLKAITGLPPSGDINSRSSNN